MTAFDPSLVEVGSHARYIVRELDRRTDMAALAASSARKRPGASRGGAAKAAGGRPSPLVARYAGTGGVIDAGELASALYMSMAQLAQTAGLAPTTISKRDRSKAPKAQARLREMLEILDRIDDWAGGETQALSWYRSQPIPALNGRTAEALVQSGQAAAVRTYLDHLALGGFA
jgi:hypothetical protein